MVNKYLKPFREQWLFFVTALVCLAIYSVFLRYGYISWDDPEMVFRNKDVQHYNLSAFFSKFYVGNYLPFTMLLHGLGWQLADDYAGFHHLISIGLHLVNGWLVLQIGRQLFKNELVAGIAMIAFLLHPLQIESVAWIGELKNVLYSSFFLGALLFYLKYKVRSEKKQLLFSFLLFVASCLSKPSAVVFPIIMFAADYFIDQKISAKNTLRYLPFIVVSILIGLINIKAQTAAQFINHAHEFPWWQRFGFSGFGLARYLTLFLAPVQLSIIYPYPLASSAVFTIGFTLLLGVLLSYIFLIKKNKKDLLFALSFILINLVLVLQFLPFGEVLNADRYMYLPVIGFAWILGLLLNRFQLPSKAVWLVLLGLLGFMTFARVHVWKNALSLYQDILKKYPDSFIALNSAGVESMFSNQDEEALRYFDQAVSSNPRNYKGYYNRGLLFLKNGRAAEAVKSFNECLLLYDYAKAYSGRASAYYQLQDFPKAIKDAHEALRLDPQNAKSYFVLGNCFGEMNRLEDALNSYNKAIALQSEEADFYFKRAIIYGKQQDFESCLHDLDICLLLKPSYSEAHYWKGVAKINLKQEPCNDFKIAAQQNFEPAVAAYNKYCR